jgi:cysteine desulfurase
MFGAMNDTSNLTLPIYLDNHATTPVDPRVLEAMLPWFSEKFGNPASESHAFGWEAAEAVDIARAQVAASLGADSKEIIFTSGATESNNIAIKGAARFYRETRDHVITLTTEHKCVLESCRRLEREGFEITVLPVDGEGLVDLDGFAAALTPRTVLASVMTANNEIGVIQPIAELGRLCRKNGTFLHTDAAQAVAKIPLDVEAMNIDLLSISGHKIYGPKGIGVLYVRRRPRVRIEPMMDGGGQERGIRSGTLATPLIVGIGEACALGAAGLDEEAPRLGVLRDRLYEGLCANLDGVRLNGTEGGAQRLPGNLNVSLDGIEAGALMAAVGDVALSSGSACTSASLEPSYVLSAMGSPDELAFGSIRFGLGRWTTQSEVDYTVERVVSETRRLRATGRAAVGAE